MGKENVSRTTGDVEIEKAHDITASIITTGDVSHVTIQTILPEQRPPLFVGVPQLPAHTLVGRDELLQRIIATLTRGEAVTLAAEGLPGVGKTALAAALARQKVVADYFNEGVLWAGLGPAADVASIQALWAEQLGVDLTETVEIDQRRAKLANAIGQQRLLLVIDDAWDLEAAEALECAGLNCSHFLTTRDKSIAEGFAGREGTLNIPTLEDDEALTLLKELAPEAYSADKAATQELAVQVGGLPLALELLGGYLAEPRRRLHAGLSRKGLAKLADPTHRLQLAQKRLGGGTAKESLAATIVLSLEGLADLDEGDELVQAFYNLGAFAPKPDQFSWEAAAAVTGIDEELLGVLYERNLIDGDETRLTLHQVLAEVARTQLDKAAAVRHRDYYLEIVNENRNDWQQIEPLYGQLKHAWQTVPEQKPLLDLVWALRIYQDRRGLRSDQLSWTQRALHLAREQGWREDEGTLLNNIGLVYNSLGQRKEALRYYNQAVPIGEEVGDRAGLAVTLNNIGGVYDALGQRAAALRYYNQARPIREEVGDRAGLAVTLNNIGLVYDNLGQREEALRYYKQARPIQEEVGDRAGLAVTIHNIGAVYDKLGQRAAALRYYKQARPIQEEVGNRAMEGTTLNNIGLVYDKLGQREAALRYYNQARPIHREVGNQAGLATTLTNIGLVYNALGQRQEALAYYNHARPIMEDVGDRAGLAVTLNNIGLVYANLGKGEEALRYFNQVRPIQEEVGDRAGESITRWCLGSLYQQQGDLAAAVEHLSKAVELATLTQSPDLTQIQASFTTAEQALRASD